MLIKKLSSTLKGWNHSGYQLLASTYDSQGSKLSTYSSSKSPFSTEKEDNPDALNARSLMWLDYYSEDLGKKEYKVKSGKLPLQRLLWRSISTGGNISRNFRFRCSPRPTLLEFTTELRLFKSGSSIPRANSRNWVCSGYEVSFPVGLRASTNCLLNAFYSGFILAERGPVFIHYEKW